MKYLILHKLGVVINPTCCSLFFFSFEFFCSFEKQSNTHEVPNPLQKMPADTDYGDNDYNL